MYVPVHDYAKRFQDATAKKLHKLLCYSHFTFTEEDIGMVYSSSELNGPQDEHVVIPLNFDESTKM